MFWIIMKWIIIIDVALFLLWAAFSFLNNVGESLCKVGDFFGKITPKTAKASTQAKSATETKPAEPEALATSSKPAEQPKKEPIVARTVSREYVEARRAAKRKVNGQSATKSKPKQSKPKQSKPKYDPYAYKTFNDPMPPEEDIEWGNDAWWDVQKRYIDESLYVNHDWDIFKDDK